MKKSLFVLAFMLLGITAFANKNVEPNVVKNLEIEKIIFRCTAEIIIENEDGEETGIITIVAEEINTQEECDELADAVAEVVDLIINS